MRKRALLATACSALLAFATATCGGDDDDDGRGGSTETTLEVGVDPGAGEGTLGGGTHAPADTGTGGDRVPHDDDDHDDHHDDHDDDHHDDDDDHDHDDRRTPYT